MFMRKIFADSGYLKSMMQPSNEAPRCIQDLKLISFKDFGDVIPYLMWFRCSWGKSFHTLHVGCHVAISRSVAQGTGPELVQDQLHSSKAMAKTLMPPPKHVPIKKKDSCMAAPHPYEVQRMLLKRTPIARLKRHAEYLLKGATCCLASAMSFFLFSSKMSIIPHKICFRHRVLLLLRGDSRSTYFGRLLGRICQ